MKYEKPEAEVQEFKTLEANAALDWGKSNGAMVDSTSVFKFQEGTMDRETFN